MRKTDQFTFFFTEKDLFSNWYPIQFTWKGTLFHCSEQAMMYAKAELFGDTKTAQKILQALTPKEQKRLGREVKGFDEKIWSAQCEGLVYEIGREKFTQNPTLLKALLNTKGTELVEASPYDRIWGIGMGSWDEGVENPKNWKGQNKLGKILTRLRLELELELELNHPNPVSKDKGLHF